MADEAPIPIYFETSWSILSSIGLINVLIGFLVVGITSLSPITIVPIVVSAASAIADGLCYYAFYAKHPKTPTAIAAGFADIFWLIQEAGLSFYSYQILVRILRRREKVLFIFGYWLLIAVVAAFKVQILVRRVQDILEGTLARVEYIDHLHIGYFIGIASVEGLSSYFLLRKFFKARSTSRDIDSKVGLFSYLMRSTEIRLTALMLIGITRTITYSFQTTAQSATKPSGQVDRFVTTMECMFPTVMFIDILAAKSLVANDHHHTSSTRARIGQEGPNRGVGLKYAQKAPTAPNIYPMSHIETWVESGARSSSQEYIVGGMKSQGHHASPSDEFVAGGKNGAINKTVEFEFHTSQSQSPV